MRTSVTGMLLTAACAVLSAATTAHAGIITGINLSSLPGNSTGSIGPLGATPAPNNDNAGAANPNVLQYNIFFNSPGLLEVEFNVGASGGITEYRFPQTFINNSGLPWTSFTFELGFGTGASFVRSGAADALDFDTPDNDPPPAGGPFPTLDRQADFIRWTGATISPVGVAAFGVSIDVPDNLQAFNPAGVSRFTLRQTPNGAAAVPEPATLLLLGSAAAGLALKRRRRARASSR